MSTTTASRPPLDMQKLPEEFQHIIHSVQQKNKGVNATKKPCMEAMDMAERGAYSYIKALQQGRLNPKEAPVGIPDQILEVLETNFSNSITALKNLRNALAEKYRGLDRAIGVAVDESSESVSLIQYALRHASEGDFDGNPDEQQEEDALFPTNVIPTAGKGKTPVQKAATEASKSVPEVTPHATKPLGTKQQPSAEEERARREAALPGFTKDDLALFSDEELDALIEEGKKKALQVFQEKYAEQVRKEYEEEKARKQLAEEEHKKLQLEKQRQVEAEKSRRRQLIVEAQSAKGAESLKAAEKKRLTANDITRSVAGQPVDPSTAATVGAEVRGGIEKGK